MKQPVAAPPVGGFVAEGERWRYAGALVMDNAAHVLAATQALPLPSSGRVDFAGLTQADSSALALIMALRRRAANEGRALQVDNLPAGLTSLALAYGVDELAGGAA